MNGFCDQGPQAPVIVSMTDSETNCMVVLNIIQVIVYLLIYLCAVYNTVTLLILESYYRHIHVLLFYITAYILIISRITELIALIDVYKKCQSVPLKAPKLNFLWQLEIYCFMVIAIIQIHKFRSILIEIRVLYDFIPDNDL